MSIWKKIAGTVGKTAPLLGTILGGPAGGIVGGIVSAALGVDNTPDAIAEAMKTDPQAAVKLRELELSHKAELEGLSLSHAANVIESVNATMRQEARSEHWWVSGWRPFWGYMSGVGFFMQVTAITYVMVTSGNVEMITALSGLSVFWAVPLSVLGITAYGRSNEKIAKTTGAQHDTIIGALAKRIGGK